jgi:hypothetical protein
LAKLIEELEQIRQPEQMNFEFIGHEKEKPPEGDSMLNVVLRAARETSYHRRPQLPHLLPQPLPPRNNRTIRSNKIAPIVALTIALIMPVPR